MAIGMRVSYQGTRYQGFQTQRQGLTIQAELERVFTAVLGPGQVLGASRTDSGVHAEGQVAVWRGSVPVPLAKLATVVNRRLPADIRVAEIRWVGDGWDPRRQVVAKSYCYRLWPGTQECPVVWRPFVWTLDGPLDWSVLQQTASWLEGWHDFWAFRSEGSSARTTERQVLSSGWHQEFGGKLWCYRVVANGFLYHMVRIMVAAMIAAARSGNAGRIRQGLLEPRVGKVAAPAPAQGLMLEWIRYATASDGGW